MILSIGEILADMINDNHTNDDNISFNAFLGGAAFNVAANIKYCQGNTMFIGSIGNDVIGNILKNKALEYQLDDLNLQIDNYRNTTLAFVSLNNGERSFTFFRNDTADDHIQINEDLINKIQSSNIVHLGSLMISTTNGMKVANQIVKLCKQYHKVISFDINLRLDLYKNYNDVFSTYQYFIDNANIIKYSEDEILYLTNQNDIIEGINKLAKENQLMVITLGKDGSMYYYNQLSKIFPSEYISPIDTTGAGDAFFGALLAKIDQENIDFNNPDKMEEAMQFANTIGRQATQYQGAITHIKK